jgi:hypothetical protein
MPHQLLLMIFYIATQQIMQVRKGYWTMWWLLGRDANAMRYNRAGAGEVNFAAFITGHFQMVKNDSLLKSGIRGYVELNAICTNRS